ncbi:restriction endonuclease [Rubellimicrobium sp. CFH 75288]|uniref:restriction endonuclease n=1 Tax=Rubellimicrobium sp. CFH 75288 TaxID=2697034 RepID=UPI00141218B1|nr:restriction endonuclease [Rubellimicrobium sp. CFH 75288]NAZ37585.1 restriction endonuclease [Rubellimicrobium sp. CFH 75288]
MIGFNLTGDVSGLRDRPAVLKKIQEVFPDAPLARQRNYAAQINQFLNVAQMGDLVVCPLKTTKQIAIGRLSGGYAPSPTGEVERPVEWLRKDVPRSDFKQDLLFSFGAIMTVCEVKRNDAAARVGVVAQGHPDPGYGAAPVGPGKADVLEEGEPSEESFDLPQAARDQIVQRIASEFTGHGLAELVEAVLHAQGHVTYRSPPGPDGGIDILAERGALGTEAPRVVVQVKSGSVTVGHQTLQSLQGLIHEVKADHGLLVAWGGFTAPVEKKRAELFFRIRFWDRDDLVDACLSVYERLPESIRARLPLQKVWVLVPENGEN